MGIYDSIVLAIVVVATLLGWRKGFSTQVASLISIVASFFVAVRFRDPVAAQIDAEGPWNIFAAMLILYLGTSLAIWLVFRQVRTSIEKMKLSEFDQQMGAIFGAVKGFALACVVTLFVFTTLADPQRDMIISSKSGVWIARAIHRASAVIPAEVRAYIDPYLRELDQGFGMDGRALFAHPNERPGDPATRPWALPNRTGTAPLLDRGVSPAGPWPTQSPDPSPRYGPVLPPNQQPSPWDRSRDESRRAQSQSYPQR